MKYDVESTHSALGDKGATVSCSGGTHTNCSLASFDSFWLRMGWSPTRQPSASQQIWTPEATKARPDPHAVLSLSRLPCITEIQSLWLFQKARDTVNGTSTWSWMGPWKVSTVKQVVWIRRLTFKFHWKFKLYNREKFLLLKTHEHFIISWYLHWN